MLLDVQQVSIERAHQGEFSPICKDLNFTVQSGEIIGILGESGSGKSVTALSLLRLLPQALQLTKGEIYFTRKNGLKSNLLTLNLKEIQAVRGNEIAIIFQEPLSSLNPVYTCGHQVIEMITGGPVPNPRFHPKQYLKIRNNVLELFEKVKLPDPNRIFHSYPYQLSGGQNQRVMIAMAIAKNPLLLIADEPTTALDATIQRSILDLLKELQQELKMSILFITHDIGQLLDFADKIIVLYHGSIVEQGPAKDLLEHPKHSYTQGLMNCRTALRKKGERLITLSEPNEIIGTEKIPKQPVSYTNDQKIIQMEAIQVSYRNPANKKLNQPILKNIDLDLYKGETLGLIGESGSGKTTLGKVLMRLKDPNTGTILFKGTPVQNLTGKPLRNLRKRIQIVFQDPFASLNPRMTIGAILTEPMKVHGLFTGKSSRKERVFQLLEQVNLPEEAYFQYPHQFSGGQRQRIGIARALAVEPEIIILDESVSALDVSIQAQIINLLNDIKDKFHLTYLFISHDLNIVRYMSNRVIILKDGEVVETGRAEDILTKPSHPYTVSLLASMSKL